MSKIVSLTTARKVKQLEASAPSNNQGKAFVGSKYRDGMTLVEINKAIRADIKAAIAAGELPEMTFSVRKRHYNSISITVEAASFRVLAAERVIEEAANPRVYLDTYHFPIYTEQATQVLRKLEAIVAAYNFDNSDSQIDYFHTNFYSNVQYDFAVTAADRQTILAEAAAQTEATEPAPAPAPATADEATETPDLAPAIADAAPATTPEGDAPVIAKIPPAFCRGTIAEMEANARNAGRPNTAAALALQGAIWSATIDEVTQIVVWSSVLSYPDPDDRDLTAEELAIILRGASVTLADEAKQRDRWAAS